MVKDEARNPSKREQPVRASCRVFDCSNGTLNPWNVFITCGCVENWEFRTERLEFVISQDGGHSKTTVVIYFQDALEAFHNCGHLTVVQTINRDEMYLLGMSDEESHLIDKHDVNF